MTPLCHFLIGPPGAGKSTFAARLADHLQTCKVASTDTVRRRLYGDETHQGNWAEIEAEILGKIRHSIAAGIPVIYDATNAKRPWRMALLAKIGAEVSWMAWYLKTPPDTCKIWNRNRDRRVPETVIDAMHRSLKQFPPLVAEGFAGVVELPDPEFDRARVEKAIASLKRGAVNRRNRTRHPQIRLHPYSRLLDFDRLLHLIALLVEYPGLGNLRNDDPETLARILGGSPPPEDSLGEVAAAVGRRKGDIYADRAALGADLDWLAENGIVGAGHLPDPEAESQELSLSPVADSGDLIAHPYSDVEPFRRLLTAVRLILNRPFFQADAGEKLRALADALSRQPGLGGDCYHPLRKDIETVLKPFGILPDFRLHYGYFAGTGILSRNELGQVFRIVQAQARSLEDPLALATYELFRERMAKAKLETSAPYPVRAIANRPMIDLDSLHPSTLSRGVGELEETIEAGEWVELGRLRGRGQFPGDGDERFSAWPLQVVFYNRAWYLGLELRGGENAGLLRFERLDRLFLSRRSGRSRSREAQDRALRHLHQLREACPGLFLGNSVADQQSFLGGDRGGRRAVEVTVELWFEEEMFRFVCEGTKRFPRRQMRMSPPPGRAGKGGATPFSLSPTGDRSFPHRFRVVLPRWSLADVDLIRWIVGFGDRVRVVKPPELIRKIKGMGEAIVSVYEGDGE